MFNDVQESALTYQAVEIADRIAAEFLVVKIHPEPNPRTAVIDVEGAGFGISGDDKKYEQGLRELDPFRDSGCSVTSSNLAIAPSAEPPTSSGVCRRSAIGIAFISPNI